MVSIDDLSYVDLKQLSSYRFLPSICVAANIITHFEREKNRVHMCAFFLVSKLIGEYMSRMFYLL